MMEETKPRLLVLSHVVPVPRTSGQRQRVYYTLRALREVFHVTFVTYGVARVPEGVREALNTLCDEVIVLPARYGTGPGKLWHRALGAVYQGVSGLKFSNYLIGRLEFAPARLAEALADQPFDCVLFEYWHAAESTAVFAGTPCVLDMHNILWKAYARQLGARRRLPAWWRRRALAQYRQHEEAAWQRFDALIAINAAERDYVRAAVPDRPVFYTPMGIDLSAWPYSWAPAQPPRIVYYGGLGSRHNQEDARRCYEEVMPAIWARYPTAELWLVGSNPPDDLRALAEQDPRVTVTGYVEQVQDVLRTMAVMLCPWSGTYGFRSRLVEALALGVPVVASPEAAHGMEMDAGRGIFFEATSPRMADVALRLLDDAERARQQSRLARAQVEEKFSYTATYERLAQELLAFVRRQQAPSPEARPGVFLSESDDAPTP